MAAEARRLWLEGEFRKNCGWRILREKREGVEGHISQRHPC